MKSRVVQVGLYLGTDTLVYSKQGTDNAVRYKSLEAKPRVGHGSGPSAGLVGSGWVGSGPTLSQTIFVVQFYA